MTSEKRVFTALAHKEPDRVPVDFASTHVTGIHKEAYNLLTEQGGFEKSREYSFHRSGLVEPCEEILQKTGSDVRGVWPNKMGEKHWAVEQWSDEAYDYVADEWGTMWKKEKKGGLYYSVFETPIPEEELTWERLKQYSYPCLADREKLDGMRQKAEAVHRAGYAVFVENPMAEILHSQTRIRGYENFMTDLLLEPDMAVYMMAQTEERMEDYYKQVLEELKDYPVIVRVSDDLGSQNSLLISADTYRELVKPLHKKLIESIRKNAKNEVKVFFHCDGAIKPLIPDLIEIGVDILNPVQYSCSGMEPAVLKREYGKDICFWGGGIDTQTTFRTGSVAEIKDMVRRQLDILMPGGGFIFSQIHNFQKGTEPDKFWAVWDTVKEYGIYGGED